MKRFMILLFLLSGLFSAKAFAQEVPLLLDGAPLPFSGRLEQGVTRVPLRRFCREVPGCLVSWDGETRTAIVTGAMAAAFPMDEPVCTLAGELIPMAGEALGADGTLFVPLRALARALNWRISYDEERKAVLLYSDSNYIPTQWEDTVFWLSRIIEAESGGEPLAGKIAVGNVVLNRVKSAHFPNSVYEVIFDRENGVQFTPVALGTIYGAPSEESLLAAMQALSGVNTAGESLYFFNPATAARAGWIVENCDFFASIGHHDFYLER